jgi:hypothetical protein
MEPYAQNQQPSRIVENFTKVLEMRKFILSVSLPILLIIATEKLRD